MAISSATRREAIGLIGTFVSMAGCSPKNPSTRDDSEKNMPYEFKAVVDSLEPWRKQHLRKAYRPVTQNNKSTGGISQFGGVPLLGPANDWPSCGRCSRSLSLLLQLDLESLPASSNRLDSGILQVFYCTRIEFDAQQYCDDYQAFSTCHHLRVIAEPQLPPPRGSIPAHAFPAVEIVDWEQFDDLPDGMEHEQLGLRYDYTFNPCLTTTDVHWDIGNVHHTGIVCTNDEDGNLAGEIASAAPKDKLLGWPAWIQDVEYPSCPRCGRVMEYFFQIDSEDHVPHMFGDLGCGHVSYCPDHPDVLAFEWACS